MLEFARIDAAEVCTLENQIGTRLARSEADMMLSHADRIQGICST
jgi:hypothetical protein